MYAITLHEFGPAQNLRYEEVPDPGPGPGQVRIAVRAAGVHLIDTRLRAGVSMGPGLPELPTIPGREVAGVVDALGPDVDESWLSARVVAHLGTAPGGYAELAVRDVAAVHRIPGELTDEVAVAMLGSGRTALGILDLAQITADDVVLVPAAAGGMGVLFTQAARRAGATVIGLAGGPDKVARIKDADLAVDYSDPGWPDQVRDRGVTVVLDGVGGTVGRAAFELLVPGGRHILFGMASGTPTEITTADVFSRGLTVSGALGPRMLNRPGGLRGLEERALAEAAAGRLVPLTQTFPLRDAAAAHTALEARATVGKVVLVP
jgi:NADPH2:quinone reductase